MLNNDFSFPIEINRATERADGYYLIGEASNSTVDLYETVMTEDCQRGFVSDIELAMAGGKPIQIEAEHEGNFVPFFNVGTIIEAKIDNNRTKIVVRLDKSNPISQWYYSVMSSTPTENRAMGRPEKLGFSINGVVKEAHRDFNDTIGKTITYFDRIELKKVGIVEHPGNAECYADIMKRSVEALLKEQNMPDGENELVVTEQEVQDEVTEVVDLDVVTEETEDGEQEETESESTDAADESGEVETSEESESEEEEVDSDETEEDSEEERSVKLLTDAPLVRKDSAEVVNGLRELNKLAQTFQDLMWTTLFEDNSETRSNLSKMAQEYSDLATKLVREMNTSDTALQVEDLDEEMTNVDMEDSNEEEQKEVRSEMELIRSLQDKINNVEEQYKNEVTELRVSNTELLKKVEELSKAPATMPAANVVVERDNASDESVRNEFNKHLDNGDVLNAIKVSLLNKLK